MLRNSSASPALSRLLLATMLCLLALAFAMEAKVAWFHPMGGRCSDIQSAKALPIPNPKVVTHGLPAPDRAYPELAVVLINCLAIFRPVLSDSGSQLIPLHSGSRVSSADFFSPPNFRRPPPAA